MTRTERSEKARGRGGRCSVRRVILLAVAAVLLAAVAAGPWPADAQPRQGSRAELTGRFEQEQFAAGEEVVISATIPDDVFAAGAEVRVEEAEVDHAILAGRNVAVRRSLARDVIAAASGLHVDATVLDDLIVAGAEVVVGTAATIGGNAYVAARDARIGGRIDGDLKAAGEELVLAGTVLGNVTLMGGDLSLAPGTRIAGTLRYASDTGIEVAEDAVVEGGMRRFDMPDPGLGWADALLGTVAAWIGTTLALLVLGTAVHLTVPRALAAAAGQLRERPWASLGTGALVLIVTPLAAVLLMVTGIGFLVGVVVMALWFVVLAVALVPTGRWLGALVLRRGTGSDRPLPGTLLGLLALAVLALIPVIGPLIGLAALLPGLGAWLLVVAAGRRRARAVP